MARTFLKLEEAADRLGISSDQLNSLREEGKVRAFRDGGSWKFASDDLDKVDVSELSAGGSDDDELELEPVDDSESEPDSILVDDQEVGDASTRSSTIIGASPQPSDQSDVRLVGDDAITGDDDDEVELAEGAGNSGSELQLADDSVTAGSGLAGSNVLNAEHTPGDGDTKGSGLGSQFEDIDELELDMESESAEEQSAEAKPDDAGDTGASEELELDDAPIELAADEDDELVLGDPGSDISLSPGDSGISLTSPTDSGISLSDEPSELSGSVVESLELSDDDDSLSLDDSGDSDADTQLRSDDDFELTPLESAEDDDDSGSQVIALDSESFDESADTMLGGAALGLEEDSESAETPAGVGGMQPAGAEMAMQPAAPEAPYTIWNVLSLILCIIFLAMTGILLHELMRNMWSWQGTSPASTQLMDALLEAIPMFDPKNQ